MEGNTCEGLKPIKTTRRKVNVEAYEPLSPMARLFHAPLLNCSIITLIGFKTNINVEIIKEGINQTMVKHPRISSKLAFDPNKPGKPIGWTRTKVNIDDHIIVPKLNYSEMESPNEVVENYVTKLAQTPMDLTKPLWEFHIINIKTKDAIALVIFRTHHSVGDCVSLMSLVLACSRKSSNPNALPTLLTKNKKKLVYVKGSSFWLLTCLLWLLFGLRMLWNTLIDFFLLTATGLFLKDTKTPLKGYPGVEKAPKRFVYRTLNLVDINLVKNFMDGTVNDAVLGITQAGLSRYLNRKYGECKGDEKGQQNHLPKHIRLRSTLMVNIRSTFQLEDLLEQMETDDPKKKANWGNIIGDVVLPFDIALRDDPLDYIRNAKAAMDKKKHSFEALLTYLCTKFIPKTLGIGVAATLVYNTLRNTTLSFSNVVGPKEETSFYGHPVNFFAPSVYGHPQALTVHFLSYMNNMTLVLAVDQKVIPDPHKLCDDIEESLKHAKQAVKKKKLFKI